MEEINWKARLIGIKGARGIGKTTLLLQYIKLHLGGELNRTLYVSLDDIWFNNHSLISLVRDFERQGGKYLFLDEVHKYPGWAQELKNIYDSYPELKIVFTGSLLMEILNARADLSRRTVVYTMQGFSFREYIGVETGAVFDKLYLNQIMENHLEEAQRINEMIKPFQYFEPYLKHGYYPFYLEQSDLYEMRLGEVVNMILEIELPLLRHVELAYVAKIKQLLVIIAESVPFVPNVSKLSDKIGINRATLLSYLHYLDEIGLTQNLFKNTQGISKLQKPSKIYLDNTNLIYLLARENANKGNLRETFFSNQLAYRHTLGYTEQGDFMVDDRFTFEIGGKGKNQKQIRLVENAYIVADDILYGSQNKIPLWMFGFLY
ncbi:ATP-binding protein [Galbibacter pacificus]|uniref:AAA family ATPase n=1 Tax=Galbibacter pacificus TaxID=2996052 RepID=A0ABT6FNA5_9FLAO|nr:AAA family ATPase [Galbibacter pacificus]MDG3581265.1 AAA family ATPase [Galbibacter pacificus]MDG3584743.1 AAA family ATPase [Galbibacter pacificus]